MTGWESLAVGVPGSLLVFVLLARLRESARARRIRAMMAVGEPHHTLSGLELTVGVSRYLTVDSLQAIQEGLARNDRAYAMRMLDSAALLIEQETPERLRRLKAMAYFSRMMAAPRPSTASWSGRPSASRSACRSWPTASGRRAG